jgi:hypothetical protein
MLALAFVPILFFALLYEYSDFSIDALQLRGIPIEKGPSYWLVDQNFFIAVFFENESLFFHLQGQANNPSYFPMYLLKIEYELYINGTAVYSGTIGGSLIPPQSYLALDSGELRIQYSDLPAHLVQNVIEPFTRAYNGDVLKYELKGFIFVASFLCSSKRSFEITSWEG